jgi:hypothetical protein
MEGDEILSFLKGKVRMMTPDLLAIFCKGCGCYHALNLNKILNPHWDFNGDYDKPTIMPSILIDTPGKRCHSYIKDGKIQYLNDCDHSLVGQTIELENEIE